jgi:NIMA (never in mitosis gene a)-related kinase
MELLSGGDVLKRISSAIKKDQYPFTEKEIWRALVHTTKGYPLHFPLTECRLKALHEVNIVHRDLKCANIFLSLDGRFKLGDLNVSKIAKKGLVYTQTGTPCKSRLKITSFDRLCQPRSMERRAVRHQEWYMVTLYSSYSWIRSLGCVLYEMAALEPPFRGNDMEQLFRKV